MHSFIVQEFLLPIEMTNPSKLVSQQLIFYWFILGSALSRFTLWSYNDFFDGSAIPNPIITNPTRKHKDRTINPQCVIHDPEAL
jgi:hypothetical protein